MPGHPPWSIVGGAAGPPGLRRIGPPRLRLQTQPLPRNDIQSPVGWLPVTDTLTLPDTRVLRLRMDGQDAGGGVHTVYYWSFVSSDETAFTVQDTDDERVKLLIPGPDMLQTGLPRTGTLTVTGLGDPALHLPVITRTFTINVVPVNAVSLALYVSLGGGPEFKITATSFSVPVNVTAVLRLAVVDSKRRNVVPPTVTWDTGGSLKYHIVATSDPQVVTLIPDTLGGSGLDITANVVVGAETTHVNAFYGVDLIESVPTLFAGQYDLELP